ncbi:serine/threonine-protein kinase [Actinoplanes sp. DH11]|uniref:serine/threonine-protein kinase n=1 Tax=Actinoplanes sp. DH11 TaxID=2857011 RepID=UPI001E590C4F|nr:serine/threonine-protein kinase [Actinoplanes sp. DH11]
MIPVGEVVAGRYRIVRPLADGGMSRVWLATDDRTGTPREVAVKHCTIPEGLGPAQRDVVREWAYPEARAAARVRHRHLIHTLEVCPDGDGHWIVMEYVPSRSLQEVVESDGPLPAQRVATIGLALLAALTAAHGSGVLHLDVKPGNVLIGDDDRVVLTDFGPAVTTAGIEAFTDAGVVLGSPKFIAPERLFEHRSTVAADLWSLGATLYHAVEGRPPYVRSSTTAVLRALADSDPDPTRLAGPLTPILTGLLRRDPADRMGAAELETRLRRVAGIKPPRRDDHWWTRLLPHRRVPAAAREATAAERLAQAAPVVPAPRDPGPAESVPADAGNPPGSGNLADAGTRPDSGDQAGTGNALGRSVDAAEPGRPSLRHRLIAALVVVTLLALLTAVTVGTRSSGAPPPAARPAAAAQPATAAPALLGPLADPFARPATLPRTAAEIGTSAPGPGRTADRK